MQRLVSDPYVTRFTPKPEPYPEGEAAREIEQAMNDRKAGTAYCFAILCDGDFAGVCKLKEVSEGRAELGYWVGVPFWGRGVATDAARLALTFAFEELKLDFVVAHTLTENEASSRVLDRLGFRFLIEEPNTHPKWSSKTMVRQYKLSRKTWEMSTKRHSS